EAELHAGGDERLLDKVVVADRGAAEGHENVGLCVERLVDRGVQGAQVVAGDAEVDRDAAAGLDDPGYGEIVRCDDLRGAERLAGRDQLVAGRQDRDARGTSDRQRDVIGRRSQRDVAGGQPAAGGKQKLALGEIESGRAQIVADGRGDG